MQKITRNTFEKGLNTDIDPSKLDPQSYVQAQNVELVGDGNFFALKNIKGLTNVSEINTTFGSNSYVLGIYENKYKNGSTEGLKGFTIFVLSNESTYYILKAYAYIPSLSLKVLMFSDNPLPLSYYTADRSIDAKSFAENGIDVLYFTDNYNELRKLRCEIPAGYSTPVYTKIDVSLQRQGSNGKITLNSITTGGSLLSGTYQFAYRMINPSTNVYTRWSTLTNPVHVYKQDSVSTGFYTSGYGVFTDRIINLTITPSPNEAQFGYYQLAVIENIFPDGDANALNASLLAIETITPGSTASYAYSSNVKIGTIPIEDIVVDYVAVDKAKTLNISRSRLFVGNIEYKNLTIPVATPPQLISGSILKDTTLTTSAVSLDTAASLNKGYFRDEVYRFGIVYFDKFGNKSAPYTLNMSAVTGNTISGSTDMKFPKRSVSGYSILNNSNFPQSLGLSLTIQRHPTWSVGFEIVRQKRIKRVLFQSPVIPMMSVRGVGAFENYPTSAVITTGSTTGTQTYSSAQPQTTDEVFVPKNLFYPDLRDISRNTTDSGTSGSTRKPGESYFTRRDNYSTLMLFPQENIYENKDYSFVGCEQLETVDFVAAKANLINYDSTITELGDDVNTNVAANFYAIEDNYYYYDNGFTGTIVSENYNISDTLYVDNYSSGDTFGGVNVLKHSDIQTDGVSLGVKPNAQRGLICKISNAIADECAVARTFSAGTYRAYPNGGSYIFGSSGATYTAAASYINDYSVSQGGFSNSVPVQQFRIANIINPNISDTRYGDKDSQNEFISTGTKYTFNSSELTSVAASSLTPVSVQVWGGDCFVTSHVFKVADSSYSVLNQEKHTTGAATESTLLQRWGTVYRITGNSTGTANLTLPVSVKGAAQYIQMFLESEYNGQAMEQDLLVSGSVSGITAAHKGTASSAVSSSTFAFSPSSNFTAGSLALISIAYDPAAPAGSDVFSSISDSHGNTYTLVQNNGISAGAANGVFHRVYKTYQNAGRLLTSSTITVTFGAAISNKVSTLSEFYSTLGNAINVFTQSSSNGTSSTPSIGPVSIESGQVIYGVLSAEANITADSDTTNGSWVTQATNTGSIWISNQYKIVNATGNQTYNPTLAASANWSIGYLYIKETPGSTFLLSPASAANGGSIAVKSCLTYNINKNTIRNNDEKVYFALPDYININYKFNSRIHYSDIKIYNTDIQGFDIFRVSNFFDLEESGGLLTKLAIAGDNMYAIQEKRISYLPASDKLLETADAGVIAVGSSDVLSIARIIDPKRGSQHIKSVVEVGSGIFMVDVLNRAVYFLQGQQLDIISDKRVASLFRSKLGTTFDENQLHGLYDPIKKEYWIVNSVDSGNKFCLIYNLGLECWVSDYYFGLGRLFAGVASDKVYLMFGESTSGSDITGHIRLYTAYTGNYSQMLTGSGNQLSSVIFYVNPDETFSKTFDDIIIEANNPLGQVNMYVERDGIQLEQNTYISVNSQNLIEGTYRVKIPRDQLNVGSRLRGLKMKTVITWQASNRLSVFRSFFTKYRLSARRPF